MSEYQYYEFLAIDRPLTKAEMAELRALSTRATITPTRFQNVYHWGDFRGDPLRLMERYFDAFVYVANWGTNRFMLRLPRRLLSPEAASPYCAAEGCAQVHATGDNVILEFTSQDEDGAGWIEDEEAEGWLPSLAPLRADLAAGDLRSLYLGWLQCAQSGELDDEEAEPPVPPGLRQLSASLTAFAQFLRIGDDLLAVAATQSPELQKAQPSPDEIRRWLQSIPEGEKDTLLLRLVEGDHSHLRAELLQRFREANAAASPARSKASGSQRTVAQLLAAAEERATARRRRQAEQEARERARREQEEAAARAAYLDTLATREEEVWRQVDQLIETKRPAGYDQAVQLLKDLRDLSTRRQEPQAFAARLGDLRARHPSKPGLHRRLDGAGLPGGHGPP